MLYAYPVVFRQDQNGTVMALAPHVPGAMTVGGDRSETLERVHGALLVHGTDVEPKRATDSRKSEIQAPRG
jgi:predicted RNase H-like HicB family nuclease